MRFCFTILLWLALLVSAAHAQDQTPAVSADDFFFSTPPPQLQWLYSEPGDYDQNGEVNAGDLTALGRHFGKQARGSTFPSASIEALLDGDGNGEINQADLVAIARNLGPVRTATYRVSAHDYAGRVQLAEVPLSLMGPADAALRRRQGCSIELTAAVTLDKQYYVERVDAAGRVLDMRPIMLQRPPLAEVETMQLGLESDWDGDGGDRSYRFSWYYFNPGDGDQNGIVNSFDSEAIGQHFNQTGPWASTARLQLVDADNNDRIDANDLVGVGSRLGRTVSGYRLYLRPNSNEYPAQTTDPSTILPYRTIPFSSALGDPAGTERLRFECEIPGDFSGYSWWVRPYVEGGWEGPPSFLEQT